MSCNNLLSRLSVLGYLYLFSFSIYGAGFNSSGIEFCANILYNCTLFNNNTASCTGPFESCMAEYAYLPPLKSEACYLADGASRTLTAVSALTASAYAFSVFGLPLLAGFYADWINTIKDYDRAEHPYLSALGKKLSKISDVDQNGKITKTEVLTPQTAIGVFSLFSVATYISELYRTQALCDYSNTLIPF